MLGATLDTVVRYFLIRGKKLAHTTTNEIRLLITGQLIFSWTN